LQSHIDIVIIPISKPLKIGLYKEGELFETFESEEMMSEFLPSFFDKILDKYKIDRVIYVNGPGSYMAIKLAYIFLKTLQIVKGIEFLATDGFYFNDNMPIKAIGNSYFVKENDTITLKKVENGGEFKLPEVLDYSKFSTKVEPIYILNAV